MSAVVRDLLGSEAEIMSLGYATDWVVATSFWFVASLIDQTMPFERDFSPEDPLISHPHTKGQVTSFANSILSLGIPFVCFGFAAVTTRSVAEGHHAALGIWASRGLARMITVFVKHRVGRLRPDFLARCKWNSVAKACTGKASDIIDGRKSFPSEHSSTIFAGMAFLSFWLAGKTAAWCFDASLSRRGLLSTRLGRLTLTLLPLFIATWVAITRVEDYRHHKEDVIVGSLIGLSTATLSYLTYWPSPFSRRNVAENIAGKPRMLYSGSYDDIATNNTYELTRLEDERETV
ncbi:lipid phosphate phosphatase 1 [Rickenella mellea]|uniref:Lipid phosphate phosphatase 1 n=1 Tax=Rickenella mellea TaxID=50990 RepID=A0A4Y7QG80_9AGAM|nr:lipid phosphate phosphatase 1 [Rickenella mellea]